ncbi:MAG: DUF488 domain-containing protein [Candidatus Saccharimonadales bacterium]
MNTIFTIGHSTRTIEEFIDLLQGHGIKQLVDIRSIPHSRFNPQFGQDKLKQSLEDSQIAYIYLKKLGGLRPLVKDSINDGWHNKSFRNYADYMQTSGFEEGIDELIELSNNELSAIMCAEAVPWRCHRSLVSDALLQRDFKVCEIIGKTNTREHTLTSFAVVNGKKITYPKSALSEK